MELNLSYQNLTSLPELNCEATFLYCFGNKLTSLPKLPNRLASLCCCRNKLTSLPELPNSLKKLRCNYNSLTSLPKLNEGLLELEFGNNKLTCVPELPNSIESCSLAGLNFINNDLGYNGYNYYEDNLNKVRRGIKNKSSLRTLIILF